MPNFITTTHRSLWMLLVGVGGILGCGSDAVGPTIRKDVMWQLSVGPPAVSIAVNETYQLPVKPLDYDGNLIDHDVSVTYTAGDTSLVVVDSTGMIRAVRSTNGQGTGVNVKVQAGLVTKSVNVWIGVTDSPVDVDSISLKPAFGEPVLTVGSIGFIRARTFDSDGNEVFNVFSIAQTVDGSSAFLMLSPGMVLVNSMWSGWVRASVFVNGKLLADSIEYRTRYRDNIDVTVAKDLNGGLDTKLASIFSTNIYISPNGQANFVNNLTTPLDVIFERPDDVKGNRTGSPGGDVIALQPRGRVSRWFPTPGDYFFTVRSGADSKRISITVKE